MASKPTLKRADSMAENMPDALRQSRYHMKRCFARYVGKGKRLMKLNHLMDEMEAVIDDKNERTKVLEGVLGYILCSTLVRISSLSFSHFNWSFEKFIRIIMITRSLIMLQLDLSDPKSFTLQYYEFF